jgi:hypothetical protein
MNGRPAGARLAVAGGKGPRLHPYRSQFLNGAPPGGVVG